MLSRVFNGVLSTNYSVHVCGDRSVVPATKLGHIDPIFARGGVVHVVSGRVVPRRLLIGNLLSVLLV